MVKKECNFNPAKENLTLSKKPGDLCFSYDYSNVVFKDDFWKCLTNSQCLNYE